VDVKAGQGRGQKAGDEKNFQFQHDSLLCKSAGPGPHLQF
jgi:hypothetical protein